MERLSRDPSLKVMVYSAAEPISPFNKVDITFPHQIEIRVNLDEVKSNLRGLKNKPGSTRPADITHLLRKRAGYENNMTVIYALTNKVCVLCLFEVESEIPSGPVLPLIVLISVIDVLHSGQPCDAAPGGVTGFEARNWQIHLKTAGHSRK